MFLEELKQYSKEIINDYVGNKLSTYEIAKKYNCYSSTVVNLLKQNNIERRNYVEASKTIYTIDEKFFDNIDTEEKAYVLGFMFSDGNNNSDNRSTSICLRLDDREILEKIRLAMRSNSPLKIIRERTTTKGYQGMPQISFRFSNSHIRNRLVELGMTKNKTYSLKFPSCIPENLIPHFLRGFYDGDGAVYGMNDGTIGCCEIVGCYSFLLEISDFCKKYNINFLSQNFKEDKADARIGKIYLYKQEEVKCFLDLIYKDSTIYLQRKYDRYYNLFYKNIPIKKYEKITPQEMLEQYGYEDIVPIY